MSKRLKFAKLRLAKPIDPGDLPPVSVPAEANVCTDSTVSGVANVCVEQDTFIVIHSEDSGEDYEVTTEQSSRRRTQQPPTACPNEGPKLPKLRKKTCEGNVLISNFLASQPGQKAEEDDDFEEAKCESPKSQPKKTKVLRAATKKPAKVPKRPRNQVDIRKVFKKYKNDHEILQELLKEHSASEQIDPEQLQMALAMSRSLAEQESSDHPTTSVALGGEDSSLASSSGSSEERRIVRIRTTLEQFGFRCKNRYTDYDLNVIFGSTGTKNVKKIKHKRATNLQLRSREELSVFIESQAKKLFPLEMIEKSDERAAPLDLDNIQSYLSNLFWIAQTELSSEQLMEKYYVPELLEANPAPVGCMLKDWSKIPGRECTPERSNDGSTELAQDTAEDRENDESKGVVDVVAENNTRMSSPDLFNDSELDNHLIVSDQTGNLVACDDSIKKQEHERVTHNEENEVQDNGSLTEPIKADENEESRACEQVVSDKCTGAREDKHNEQALENDATTSCEVKRLTEASHSAVDQLEVIVLDDNSGDEEDKFITAPEMSECLQPAFHQSSENIFDDSDLNPMVSFEAYSSEEEKISAASRALMGMVTTSNGDIGTVDQVPIVVIQEKGGKCNTPDLKDDYHQNMQDGEETNNVSKTENQSKSACAKGPRFSAEKDLSFSRLAIKARLSEITMVEMVDLIGGTPSNGNPSPNFEELEMERVVGTQNSELNNTQDDVLYISDDEVNYSIHGEPSRARDTELSEKEGGDNGNEEDPDMTIAYTVVGSIKPCEGGESPLPLNSDILRCTELGPEILTISSNENDSEPVVAEVICAENTFAYLDNLVKEFNLPLLKSQQRGVPETPMPNPTVSKISVDDEKRFQGRNSIVDQDVSVIGNHIPEISDELSHYLNNYEEPNFNDHEIEAEMIASQRSRFDNTPNLEIGMPSSKVLSRVKSCTQFDSPKIASPLRRTPSEAVLPSSSYRKEKGAPKQPPLGVFENKFNDLKHAVIDLGPAEYVISTVKVSQQPPEYDGMSTPEIERELYKYGLKSLQRNKAVRVLNYLFESMHPTVVVEERTDDKLNNDKIRSNPTVSGGTKKQYEQTSTPCCSIGLKRPRKRAFKLDTNTLEYFLPSKPRKRVSMSRGYRIPKKLNHRLEYFQMAWCAVPLHISFFNLVSESEALQRQILRYEPINLDDIYGILKDGGLRYETNDLIAFLDKYCITFRTAASSGDRTAKEKAKDGNK
uniref:Structure-specific endonuclease subunit SLX4 n=1 Tax=Anopheles christyi TaxID=43041 RepID=A0A182JRC5_9DIPT